MLPVIWDVSWDCQLEHWNVTSPCGLGFLRKVQSDFLPGNLRLQIRVSHWRKLMVDNLVIKHLKSQKIAKVYCIISETQTQIKWKMTNFTSQKEVCQVMWHHYFFNDWALINQTMFMVLYICTNVKNACCVQFWAVSKHFHTIQSNQRNSVTHRLSILKGNSILILWTQTQSSLSVCGGLLPGPLRIPKSADAEASSIKCHGISI